MVILCNFREQVCRALVHKNSVALEFHRFLEIEGVTCAIYMVKELKSVLGVQISVDLSALR